jgi:regulator of sigma E protease
VLLALGEGAKKEALGPPLDPVRLPDLLAAATAKSPRAKKRVTLTVLGRRPGDHQRGPVERGPMPWDATWDYNTEVPFSPASPLSIPQLGLAYHVTSKVKAVEPGSPAARARRVVKGSGNVLEKEPDALRPGDVVYKLRVLADRKDGPEWSPWLELRTKRGEEEVYEQWAYVSLLCQKLGYPTVQLGIRRDGKDLDEPFEVTLTRDGSWQLRTPDAQGLLLAEDRHLHRAESMKEALSEGVEETWRFITNIYLGLTRLVQGRVSTKTLGGPIEIVSTTFTLAHRDFYGLLLFLGILSINLAVVNFLPIPLLDGGHMVFLIYEKLRGKPASEQVRAIAAYIGLAILLSLMVFVFYNDIRRKWFGG